MQERMPNVKEWLRPVILVRLLPVGFALGKT